MHFLCVYKQPGQELCKEWPLPLSPPIKKLGKHSTNQKCHYFRLNTGIVSRKKTITQAGRCSLWEYTNTKWKALAPSASKGLLNHFKQSFLLPDLWSPLVERSMSCPVPSCVARTERAVCPFIHVHKQLSYREITDQSTFKTQFSVKNKKRSYMKGC